VSRQTAEPSEKNAVKVSKISADGKTLSKQWIIRANADHTPSSYYYFVNSHKMWHKLNPNKTNVPSVKKGIPSGITVVDDPKVPLSYTLVKGSITVNTNYATQMKNYFVQAIKDGIIEPSGTIDSFTASGGFYIFEPLNSIIYGGTSFMATPSEMAKLDIADGGTSSAYGSNVKNYLSSYTQRQAPELCFAEKSYSSLGITGGKPAFDTGKGDSGRWRSPTILSSALGFGVVSGEGLCKVTFDWNINNKGTYSTKNVTYNTTVSKPSDPSLTGYTFGGWHTGPKCTVAFDFYAYSHTQTHHNPQTHTKSSAHNANTNYAAGVAGRALHGGV